MHETNYLKLKTYEGTDIFDPLTVENANNRTVDDFASNITYTVTEQGTHQQEQDAAAQALETRMGQAETNITNNQQAIGTVQAEADKNKEDIDGIKDDILRQDRQLDSLNESMMDVSETAQDAKTSADEVKTTADEAKTTADEAKTTADDAKTAAESAQETATQAQNKIARILIPTNTKGTINTVNSSEGINNYRIQIPVGDNPPLLTSTNTAVLFTRPKISFKSGTKAHSLVMYNGYVVDSNTIGVYTDYASDIASGEIEFTTTFSVFILND